MFACLCICLRVLLLSECRQLLYECGIGIEEEEGVGAVVSQHRVLLFCQYKSMLDIIENDLLKCVSCVRSLVVCVRVCMCELFWNDDDHIKS